MNEVNLIQYFGADLHRQIRMQTRPAEASAIQMDVPLIVHMRMRTAGQCPERKSPQEERGEVTRSRRSKAMKSSATR